MCTESNFYFKEFAVFRITILDGSKTAYQVYYSFTVSFYDAVFISDHMTSKVMVVPTVNKKSIRTQREKFGSELKASYYKYPGGT